MRLFDLHCDTLTSCRRQGLPLAAQGFRWILPALAGLALGLLAASVRAGRKRR